MTDFFFGLYMMRSKHIQAPWYNDYFSDEKFENVTIYDEHTLAIRFYKAKPDVIEKIAGGRCRNIFMASWTNNMWRIFSSNLNRHWALMR